MSEGEICVSTAVGTPALIELAVVDGREILEPMEKIDCG